MEVIKTLVVVVGWNIFFRVQGSKMPSSLYFLREDKGAKKLKFLFFANIIIIDSFIRSARRKELLFVVLYICVYTLEWIPFHNNNMPF